MKDVKLQLVNSAEPLTADKVPDDATMYVITGGSGFVGATVQLLVHEKGVWPPSIRTDTHILPQTHQFDENAPGDVDFWRNYYSSGAVTWQNHEVSLWLKPLVKNRKPGVVLVPLCGQSWDLMYFHDLGWHVIGVDCSEDAMVALFRYYGLSYTENRTKDDFVTFKHGDRFELVAGDVYELLNERPDLIGKVDLVVDRASFVALPKDCAESKYIPVIKESMKPSGDLILASLSELPVRGEPPHVYEEVASLNYKR